MKKALISPMESVESGYRVVQVEENSFEIATPLFWVECEDDVIPNESYYDPVSHKIIKIPSFTTE
jgi:hypothetical protein